MTPADMERRHSDAAPPGTTSSSEYPTGPPTEQPPIQRCCSAGAAGAPGSRLGDVDATSCAASVGYRDPAVNVQSITADAVAVGELLAEPLRVVRARRNPLVVIRIMRGASRRAGTITG